jgi:F0F1-type ATP synthase assembly protein I
MAPKKQVNPWEVVGRYTSLAFLLPASTFAGYLAGYLLDRWLGTNFLKVVCLLLGTAGGFVQFVRQATRGNHRDSG